jgi:pilus assembly protein CpaF
VELNPLYEFQETGEHSGRVQGGLAACGNPLLHTGKLQMAGINDHSLLRFSAASRKKEEVVS